MISAGDIDRHRERVRRRALIRLGVFGVFLAALAAAVLIGGVIDVDRATLQDEIRDFGPLAPVIFVLVSGALGAMFVPGPTSASPR